MSRRRSPSSPDEGITYRKAMEELEAILARLQGEGEEGAPPDIDTLAADVRRAADLIALCRERLQRTREEVASIVKEFAAEEAKPAAGEDPGAASAEPGDEKDESPF